MEAEKADVIISCFITLSGPLCNLPCKALTAGFSTSAKHLSKWIKYTEKYLWSFPGRAHPGSREPRSETPGRAKTAPLYSFFKGGSKCRDFLIFFFLVFCFGWGFGDFSVLLFKPLSVREGGGGNAHLYLNRDLFFLIRFVFPLFFFLLLFSTRFCWPVWRTLLCLHWKTQRSKHRLPLPQAPWVCM